MSLEAYPTKFECYEENEPVFNITTVDEIAAELKVSACITKQSWPDISEKIQECLNKMFPEKEGDA